MKIEPQHILDQLADAVVATTVDGRIAYANRSFERLLGWQDSELRGQSLALLQPPRLREASNDVFAPYLRRQSRAPETPVVVPELRHDGSEIEVEVRLSTSDAPNPDLVVISMRDARGRRESERHEERARHQLEFTGAITRNLASGVCALDRSGRIAFLNPAAERMLGWSESGLIGRSFHDTVHPEHDAEDETCLLQTALEAEDVSRVESDTFVRKDRTTFPVEYTTSVLQAGDYPVGTVLSFQDLTEKQNAEKAQREVEQRYRSVVETSADSIVLVDLTGSVLMANGRTADILGFDSPELLLSKSIFNAVHGSDRSRAVAALELRVALNPPADRNTEYTLVRADGTTFPAEVSSSVVLDSDGKPAAVTITTRDITERRRVEQALEWRALHDPLTDLPNRSLMYDRLEQAIRTAHRSNQSLALLFLDLNRFKEANDTYGHHYGDQVLRGVGRRIRDVMRESDTVARLGGDEFSVLLPGAARSGAVQAAAKILQAVNEPFEFPNAHIVVGTSIGIALYPEHGDNSDALIRHADRAMYMAKKSGLGYSIAEGTRSGAHVA